MPAISTSLPTLDDLRDRALASLGNCAVAGTALSGDQRSITPILGADLARVRWSAPQDADDAVARAQEAFRSWRQVPGRPAAPSSSTSAGSLRGTRQHSPR